MITMAKPYGKPLPDPASVSNRTKTPILAEWVNEAENRLKSVPTTGTAVKEVTDLISARASESLGISDGALVFVVNRVGNETSVTDARARQFFSTFEEPPSELSRVSLVQLTKIIEQAGRYHVVTIKVGCAFGIALT